MRIPAAFAMVAVVVATASAQSSTKDTHGSVHLNPAYTTTPARFIDAHDK